MMDMDPIDIDGCTFNNNVATYGKGAVIESNNVLVRLVHCTVSHNTAVECGAMEATWLDINNSTFTYNSATGIDEAGGRGVACISEGSIRINNSHFEHNVAAREGGVMKVDNSHVVFYDSEFNSNTASESGGIVAVSCDTTLSNCSFFNNTGIKGIGLMKTLGSILIIENCLFQNMLTFGSSGVLYIEDSALDIATSKFSDNIKLVC